MISWERITCKNQYYSYIASTGFRTHLFIKRTFSPSLWTESCTCGYTKLKFDKFSTVVLDTSVYWMLQARTLLVSYRVLRHFCALLDKSLKLATTISFDWSPMADPVWGICPTHAPHLLTFVEQLRKITGSNFQTQIYWSLDMHINIPGS